MDWSKIKTEYITDESSSYRKLAEKYGVSLTAITNRSKGEGWVDQKKQFKDKTTTKSIEKIAERKLAKQNKDFAKADAIRAELLEKGIELIDTREGTKFQINK